MRNKASPIEYLALLSVKYRVDADKFLQAMLSAMENHRSDCGCLSIECRRKQKESIVLLITKESKVVAQFKISTEFLQKRNPINDIRNANMLCRRLIKKDKSPHSVQVKDLRIGMKNVNLKAEVVEIVDSSCSRMMCGSFPPGLQAPTGDDLRCSTVVASDSRSPCVASS